MVDHMIGIWEGRKGKNFQIRNKVKEGRSLKTHLNGKREDL